MYLGRHCQFLFLGGTRDAPIASSSSAPLTSPYATLPARRCPAVFTSMSAFLARVARRAPTVEKWPTSYQKCQACKLLFGAPYPVCGPRSARNKECMDKHAIGTVTFHRSFQKTSPAKRKMSVAQRQRRSRPASTHDGDSDGSPARELVRQGQCG